jgi:hypothetical protein
MNFLMLLKMRHHAKQIICTSPASTHHSRAHAAGSMVGRKPKTARYHSLMALVLSKVCGMHLIFQRFLLLVFLTGSQASFGQNFFYVEPGNPACPVVSPPAPASPKTVKSGVAVPGSIRVGCGFDKGSYTVNLNASDPLAAFSPKSFLVNFGSISGPAKFTVTFATIGTHTMSATITSNMGSPAVPGRFSSLTNEFAVVRP